MKLKKLLNFEDCLKCRECCKFKKGEAAWAPIFSRAEIDAIVREYKIKPAWRKYKKSINSFRPRLVKSQKDIGLYVCPFLDRQRYSCMIEKLKPFDCRIWPFVLMRNRKKEAINLVYYGRKYCPGLENIGRRRFETYKKYLINFCRLNSIAPYLGAVWDFDDDAIRVCEVMKIPKGTIF